MKKKKKLTTRDEQRLHEIADALGRACDAPIETAADDEYAPWLNRGERYIEVSEADYELIEPFLYSRYEIMPRPCKLPDAGDFRLLLDGNSVTSGTVYNGENCRIRIDNETVNLKALLRTFSLSFGAEQ